jgi:tyrosinase
MFTNETERLLYQEAASNIRLPYWDWALAAPPGQTHLPDVFWHPTIVQYGPRGVQNIRNPLYSYRFHPVEEEAFIWSPVGSTHKLATFGSH